MIDINIHGSGFTARSVVFSENYDPFVTFEIYADDVGGTCFYIRNIEDAQRIAQAALDLLKNVQSFSKQKDTTND